MTAIVVVLMALNLGLLGGLLYAVYVISKWYTEFANESKPLAPVQFEDADWEAAEGE